MKSLIILMGIILTPIFSHAVDSTFVKTGGGDKNVVGTIVNGVVTSDSNYYVAPGNFGMGKMSTAITYAPKTYSAVSFSTNAYTIGGSVITAASHGFTTGIEVLLAATEGTVPSPLVTGTTYFAIAYTADSIQLATTSAQAFSGDPIVLLAKGTGTQTYSLTALAAVGNTTLTYSGSNDGTNFFSLSVSSVIVLGSPTNTWQYDFTEFNYSILRLAITAPTVGAITVQDYINLKP
jgi:hypothetical protein